MLVFAMIIAGAALGFTFLVRSKDIPEPIPVSPTQHLDDRKQAIYENLRDLQFEYRLGKLSDEDYQHTKLSLQRELAMVLKETEEITKRMGLPTATRKEARTASLPVATPSEAGRVCPHCAATFARPLRSCGECGKAMA